MGLPNAGKSSLFNALLDQKISIVSAKPQTTRGPVRGYYLNDKLKLAMVLIDTPGIQDGKKALNQALKRTLQSMLQKGDNQNPCDVLAFLVDPTDERFSLMETDQENLLKKFAEVFASFDETLPKTLPIQMSCLPVINKTDSRRWADSAQKARDAFITTFHLFLSKRFHQVEKTVLISTRTKEGFPELLEALSFQLPEGPLPFEGEAACDAPLRVLAAEFVREQCFEQLGQEIPYSVAVVVDTFKEDETLTRIEASIFVERESQKGIVVGAKGARIKSIGMAARQSIENLVGNKIYLGLKVKVAPSWASEAKQVERFL